MPFVTSEKYNHIIIFELNQAYGAFIESFRVFTHILESDLIQSVYIRVYFSFQSPHINSIPFHVLLLNKHRLYINIAEIGIPSLVFINLRWFILNLVLSLPFLFAEIRNKETKGTHQVKKLNVTDYQDNQSKGTESSVITV